MKLREVTGWKQKEFELMNLEGGVDEDLLFDIVKENDLVVVFDKADLELVLGNVSAELSVYIQKKLGDKLIGSNDKRLSAFYYDPIDKKLIGKAHVEESDWNNVKAKYTHWFFVTGYPKLGSSVTIMDDKDATDEELKKLVIEHEMIDLRQFISKAAWIK